MKTQPSQFIAGFPTEWEDFERRNRLFLERYSNLSEAFSFAFKRTLAKSEPIERFVFGYGQLCREDFLEVFLLSANGYGMGATKLLRSLYEHSVTLYYLSEHPNELDNFWDYSYVTEHKLMKSMRETYGSDAFKNSSVREAEIEERFLSVKERFMTTDCKKCGTKKVHHNWNKLDLVSMAKQSGPLGDSILHGYFGPLTQAHSHPVTLTSRLTLLENGGMSFDSGPQRNVSDVALLTAHEIVLCVLDVQQERFNIPDLSEKLQVCRNDLEDIRNEPRKKI